MWEEAKGIAAPGLGDSKSFLSSIIVASIGLIGTLSTVIGTWIRDRDEAAQKNKKLDYASHVVQFWKEWTDTVAPLGTLQQKRAAREKAKAELDAVAAMISVLPQAAESQGSRETLEHFLSFRRRLPAWRRWSLIYKPARKLAYVPRVFFWLYFLTSFFAFQTARLRFEEHVRTVQHRVEELKMQRLILGKQAASASDKARLAQYDTALADASRDLGTPPVKAIYGDVGDTVLGSIVLCIVFGVWSRKVETPRTWVSIQS